MPRNHLPFSASELEALPLFRFVPLECIEGILEHSRVVSLGRGERFEPAGPLGHAIHLILEGRLAVYYDVRERDDTPLHLERGDIVGQSLVSGEPEVPCTLAATEDTRLMVLEEDLIWSLAQASHAAACNLLGILLRGRGGSSLGSFSGTVRDYALRNQAVVDPLTGFQSRRWLEEILSRQVDRFTASGRPLSLVMIDIDGFRAFNERHGRTGGDRALHDVAQTLRNSLRPGELVARYGGDTFAVLLPETEPSTAGMIADRLRQRLMHTVIDMGDGTMLPPLSISAGVAEATPGIDGPALAESALAALDRAKAAGGNTVSR